MKLLILILALGVPGVLFGQYADSSSPKVLVPMTIGIQTYVPGIENRFDMTYRFVAGVRGQLRVSRHFLVMGGGRFWGHVNGSYGINSRSWGQSGFHGALGVFYTKRVRHSTFFAGVALNRLSYFLGGMFPGETNEKFQRVTRAAIDTVPGIRGNYYTAPYVFLQLVRKVGTRKLTLELNAVIPGRFPSPINSWQPGGALVHAVRTKVVHENMRNRWTIDAQLPVITTTSTLSYQNMSFSNMTGKLEWGRVLKLTGGSLVLGIGYERDWHALNFPRLLKRSKQCGSWGALYVGVVLESALLKR